MADAKGEEQYCVMDLSPFDKDAEETTEIDNRNDSQINYLQSDAEDRQELDHQTGLDFKE